LIHIREGADELALADFSSAIDLKEDFALAYHERAGLKKKKGDLQGAHFDYQTAIACQPRFPLAYNNRGSVKILLGDYEGAIADYSQALEQDPEMAIALSNRGYAYYYMGDMEHALQDFDAAIALDKSLPDAVLNKASLLAKQEQTGTALELLDGMLEDFPEDASLFLNRGLIRELSGDLAGACEDWKRALELGAEEAEAYLEECNNLGGS
jgi:Tfp pilus assembly protein PilF